MVPMSPQRVLDLQESNLDFKVKIGGRVGETVSFRYIWDYEVIEVKCVISQAGTAVVSIADAVCYSV